MVQSCGGGRWTYCVNSLVGTRRHTLTGQTESLLNDEFRPARYVPYKHEETVSARCPVCRRAIEVPGEIMAVASLSRVNGPGPDQYTRGQCWYDMRAAVCGHKATITDPVQLEMF